MPACDACTGCIADTVGDLGYAQELGNYGEYSGAPNTAETYLYAKTVLECVTANPDGRGRALLIGGGIANFTGGQSGAVSCHEVCLRIPAHHIRMAHFCLLNRLWRGAGSDAGAAAASSIMHCCASAPQGCCGVAPTMNSSLLM